MFSQSQNQKKYDVLHGSLNDKMLFVQPKVQISDLKKKFFNEGISPRGRLSSENNEMETSSAQQSQVWRATQSCSGSPGTIGGCSPHSLQGLMFLEFNQTDPENVTECPPKNESLRSAISRPFSGSVSSLNKTTGKQETLPTELPKDKIIPIISECNPCSGKNSMPHIHDKKVENKNSPSKSSEKTFQTIDDFDCSEAVASIYRERSNILEQTTGEKSSFSDANNLPVNQHLKDSTSELSSKMSEFKMNFLARERKNVLNISLRRSDELPIFRSKKKDQSLRNKIQDGEKPFSGNKERLENFSDSETQDKKRSTSNSFCRVLAASIGSLASFYSTFSSSNTKTTSPAKTRKIFKTTSVKPPLTTTMSATDVLSSSNRRCSSFFVSRSSKDRKGVFQSPGRQYVRNRSGTSNSSNDSITELPTSAPVTFGANKNN